MRAILRSPQIKAFLLAIIFTEFGRSFGFRYGEIDLGIIIATLLATVLATQITPKRPGTWFIPLLIGSLGEAHSTGNLSGLVLSLIVGAIAICFAAQPFAILYNVPIWQAIAEQFRLMTGLTSTFQVVDDGRITLPGNGVSPPGPVLTIISPGHAAAFQSGGSTTRVRGPGVTRTVRFESIKRVLDLRPRSRLLEFTSVLTSDPIRTIVRLEARFSLKICPDALSGTLPLTPWEQQLIERIDERRISWDDEAVALIEQCVRNIVGGSSFVALYNVLSLTGVQGALITMLDAALSARDMQLDALTMIDIQPAAEVVETLDDAYMTGRRNAAQARAWVAGMQNSTAAMASVRGSPSGRYEITIEMIRYLIEEYLANQPEN